MGNNISFEFKAENNQSISYDYFQSLKKVEGNKKDCYLVLYETKNGDYHTSIVTDIWGQSTSKTIKGLVGIETHLIFLNNGENQKLTMETRTFKPTDNYEQKLFYLGPSIVIPDCLFALNQLFINLYKDYLLNIVKSENWSEKNNCQTYCKYLIDKLSLSWPDSISNLQIESVNISQQIQLYSDIKNSI